LVKASFFARKGKRTEHTSLARTLNGMRGAALEMAYGCAGGAKLWRANPRSGTGMKQGRQGWGGAKRQEVAKT
jgi:hypothetical protein